MTFAICSSHFQSVAGTTTTVALVFRLLSAPVTAWQLDNWRSECLGRSEAPSEKEFRDLEMVGIVITFRVFIPWYSHNNIPILPGCWTLLIWVCKCGDDSPCLMVENREHQFPYMGLLKIGYAKIWNSTLRVSHGVSPIFRQTQIVMVGYINIYIYTVYTSFFFLSLYPY